MSTAREAILARVRTANSAAATSAPIPRGYRRADERPRRELAELFRERAADYKAEIERVPAERLREAIAAASARHGGHRLVVPPGLTHAWRPAQLELIEDNELSARELDRLDGVITGCTAAIAETGTIALSAGPHEGRRLLTLVPDLHICVVHENQIVADVPQAMTLLAEHMHRARRPLTLISGPSATSDIELQRVEGVHGPRRLVVLIATGSTASLL